MGLQKHFHHDAFEDTRTRTRRLDAAHGHCAIVCAKPKRRRGRAAGSRRVSHGGEGRRRRHGRCVSSECRCGTRRDRLSQHLHASRQRQPPNLLAACQTLSTFWPLTCHRVCRHAPPVVQGAANSEMGETGDARSSSTLDATMEGSSPAPEGCCRRRRMR